MPAKFHVRQRRVGRGEQIADLATQRTRQRAEQRRPDSDIAMFVMIDRALAGADHGGQLGLREPAVLPDGGQPPTDVWIDARSNRPPLSVHAIAVATTAMPDAGATGVERRE